MHADNNQLKRKEKHILKQSIHFRQEIMDSESNDAKDPFEGFTEKEIESSEVSQDSNTQEIKSVQDHSDENEVESHDIEEEDTKDASEDDDDNDSMLGKALEPSIDIKTDNDDDDDDIAVIEEKAPPPKLTFECRECGSIFKGKNFLISLICHIQICCTFQKRNH